MDYMTNYLMKKTNKSLIKLVAIFLAILLTGSIAMTHAEASTVSELAAQINAINGLFADAGTNVVTVTGSNENITTPLTLDIPSGVTVNWEATYTGAVSPASTSMITLSGSGRFDIRNYGAVINNGTGNTISITGSGTVIRVYNNGTVQSSRSGCGILVLADNAEVDVGLMGSVISLDGNANAAIQIGGGSAVSGNVVNVNGGTVISIGSGFAINDGAGTSLLDNDTRISVTSGVISAGGNSAIHSTGIRSSVAISGGIISNAAGNNLNPTIDMQGDMTGVTPLPVYNITVGGTAVVQSTSVNGYTLQSKGNVLIQGEAYIAAINGRAINLVGMDSTALIRGGTVETSGSGTAISTATTNVETVVRASIEVTGGVVTSAGGYAINATGANSKVTVSGGSVSTTSASNHAINATGTGVTIAISGNTEVSAVGGDAIHTAATVSGAVSVSGTAKVSSITGRAIQANGTGAGIMVSGNGSQIWVLNAGDAIRCTHGTVTLYSGFIFAYGVNAAGVINSPNIVVPAGNSNVLIISWNIAAGNREYYQGPDITPPYNRDLDLRGTGSRTNYYWHNHPTIGGGINYVNGQNVGFFYIPEVTIIRDYGLIFHSATGRMYRNTDGTGNLTFSGGVAQPPNNIEFIYFKEGVYGNPQWGSSPGELRLYGFSWATNLKTIVPGAVPAALTIVGGPTTIVINGDSRFESTNPDGGAGIKFGQGDEVITFRGDSTLRAVGANSPGIGIDIGDTGVLTIAGGTFIAQAGRAIQWEGSSVSRVTSDPSTFDYSWTFSQNFDGTDSTTGYGVDTLFELFDTDLFVMFTPVTPVNLLSAVQIGGVSHAVDSVAIRLTFDKPVSGLTADDIEIINQSGEAVKGVLNGSGTTWMLTLNSVDAEGLIDIKANNHFDTYYLLTNEINGVEIYKADMIQFDVILTNTVQNGGDFEKLFEFELFFASDPREPQPISLTADPYDPDPDVYLVTYANPTLLPPGRITGPNNNILSLKHGEAVRIYGLPAGFYFVSEHQNQGFITAFDIDSEGWFTAPEGNSRIFRLMAADVAVDTFNSIVLEEPGEPERPFDPNDPDVVIEPDAFNLVLSKTVQTGGDFDALFEFEVLLDANPNALQALPLSIDPLDEGTFYVTYTDGSRLPPDRITGDDHSVLLLKHDEAVMIRNIPIGFYNILEHVNDGFITAYNINDGGWFTAPDGLSRRFGHDSETTADCFNSIVPEVPGEPSRPIDPNNPAEPYDPEKSPQTGDSRSFALPITMLILGILCIVGGIKVRTGV